jgi:Flp pilus assembly pilin Flp
VHQLHVHIHVLLRAALQRLRTERGQTSAEYALVLLGAASVALLVVLWARDTGKVGDLLDTMFDSIVRLAG